MSKFTPGPWEALHDADGDHAIFANGKLVAITYADSEEDEACAKLIAAAPQMYEALTKLLDKKTSDITCKLLILAALAKADGGAK